MRGTSALNLGAREVRNIHAEMWQGRRRAGRGMATKRHKGHKRKAAGGAAIFWVL
jgi:hypothetical protein